MTRLPSLGAHGEGWVLLQLAVLTLTAAAGLTDPAWTGELRVLTAVIGVALILAGLGLSLRAIVELRGALSPFPRPRAGAALVQDGVYAVVRHPIYAGLITATFGWALLTAAPAAVLGAAALALVLDLKSRREEVWLAERYPEYEAYRRRTRRFVPNLY